MTTIPPRVLFVDDEQPVLDAIAANLRRGFDVQTATSGAAGLDLLRGDATIAVVVSDMRMPLMNGATFLTHAREIAPNAVRILLTGQTDIDSAVTAVNKGQLFRFLTKPCARDDLRAAVEQALEQHRLQTAERELLEQTLRGSIKALIDLLALTNPGAFGRANRIKTRVLELAAVLEIEETWQLEIAALASQLGYIVLPRELCDKLDHGAPLTEDERRAVARAPETTPQLLASIPRLEGVCEMLTLHLRPPRRAHNAPERRRMIELGAHLLRFAVDLDELENHSPTSAVDAIKARSEIYDAEVISAYERAIARRLASQGVREIQLGWLRVGMTLADDVRLVTGALLVSRGYEVTAQFIERLRNFPPNAVVGPIRVITS